MGKKTKTKAMATSSPALVHFEFMHPAAANVCIAGSFNDWHSSATPMVSMGDGRWAKELVLSPGTYEYRFIVDGEWVTDEGGREVVSNPFGSRNTLLHVSAVG